MYNIFEKLCKEKNVTAYRVAQETGVTTTTLTNWKKGKYVPKHDKLQKIADYFGVTLDYLMTGHEPENPLLSSDSAFIVAKMATDTDFMDIAKKYFELPEEKQKFMQKYIENLFEMMYSENKK